MNAPRLPTSPAPPNGPKPRTTLRSFAWLCLRCRTVLLLLAGLGVLDLVVYGQRERWAHYCPDDYRERLVHCRDGAPDLIFVGGSPVSEGIEPAVLVGVRIDGRPMQHPFNFGLLGATASEFWHAIENGVRTPPAVLIYGASASDINDARQEPHGAYSLMTWADLADWVRHRPASAGWVSRQFIQGRLSRCWQLFHYRNAIRLWLADWAENCWPGSFPETAREARGQLAVAANLRRADGFAPNPEFRDRHHDELKIVGVRQDHLRQMERYRVGEHLDQVYRLIDWCAARGVTFLVVDMPVTVDLSERLYPAAFATYRQALDDMEHRRGVRIVRGGREGAGLTDHDFSDLVHLNAGGARKFSRWLRTRLEETDAGSRGRHAP